MNTPLIDTIKAWLWLPVIAILFLIAAALEANAEKPRKEAGDCV